MSADNYDIHEELPSGPRRLGRVAPAPTPVEIDIVVNGVVFGTVVPDTLKAKAQIDLERAKGALDLLRWCQTHGGISSADLPALEVELGEMPLQAIMDLIVEISAALSQAVEIPKSRGRR